MKLFATICIGAAFVASAFATSAPAAVIVRSVDDLVKDKRVVNLSSSFSAVSAATVVYDKCVTDYKLTPEQVAFSKELFGDVSKQYIQAFIDAYMDLVGAAPDQKIADSYMQYIQTQQKNAVNATGAVIKQKGCGDSRITKIATYVEKVHHADMVAKAQEEQKKRPRYVAPVIPADAAAAPMAPLDQKK